MILTEKFEVHDTLNPKLWSSENELLDDVKVRIVEIVEQFLSTTCEEVPLNIVDVRLVGSQCNYTYTEYSDLDVHIVTNFELLPATKEILQALYNALKTKFNNDYDITIKGIDVELYVEDIRSTAVSNGIYSVYQNKWIKFPEKPDNIPQVDISHKVDRCKEYINKILNSEDSDRITNTINDIYLIRKDSLDKDGEYGEGNLLFKEIRNLGFLDALKDRYKEIRSKELTLEHLRLTEASRVDLLSKSKKSNKGFERFKKRVKSRIANSVKQYNAIDMNKLFKEDILTVDIQVKGETDNYIVTMTFGGFLDLLHDQIKQSGQFNLKAVTRAVINGFNKDDVYIHCSCLHPETRIKLLDGRTVTVAEMHDLFERGEKLYVYSTDKSGDFKPGEVEKVWITKQASEFIRIVLDNGEELLTTPEHPYMLRTGEYIRADELDVGTSLMPMYFSETTNGYETVRFNSTGKYHSTYKVVANELLNEEISAAKLRVQPEDNMRYEIAVHHRDFIKSNNHPDNLLIMTAREHWNYHNSLSFPNKPLSMQNNIRESSRQNAIKRNADPTDAMIAQRNAFQEAGKQRNYDADRREQQSQLAKQVFAEYYANITNEQAQYLHDIRSKNTTDAWVSGCYDTDQFHMAAKLRGENLRSAEVVAAAKEGVDRYWAEITPEEKEVRIGICRNNLKKAQDAIRGSKQKPEHTQKIKDAYANRTREQKLDAVKKAELTKLRRVFQSIIDNKEPVNNETFLKYTKSGVPHYTKHFSSIDEAVTYFELNHKVVSVERIILEETPVYDIKVKDWNNFVTAAGVVLHNCPDWKYRYAYFATRNDINSGEAETRPSDITNPNDSLGSACKHVLLVLSNTSWCLKVSSVIYNYVNYMEKHYERLYQKIIYPAIYEQEYEDRQLDMFDDDELTSTTDTIDKSNVYAKTKNQFQKGNEYRFKPDENKDQMSIDDEDSTELDNENDE